MYVHVYYASIVEETWTHMGEEAAVELWKLARE